MLEQSPIGSAEENQIAELKS